MSIDEEMRAQNELRHYHRFLETLIDNDDLTDTAAVGITKQVIAEGERSLSAKQAYVFKTKVTDVFPQPTCEECGELIPWDEAYDHIHEGSTRCSSCQHRYQRFMDER